MLAGIKNIRTFVMTSPKSNTNLKKTWIFYVLNSAPADKNIGYQIPPYYHSFEVVTDFGESGGDSLSFINNYNFHTTMPKSVKITPKLNNSKLTSTSVARNATPTLTLTGVKNPYLFCLRKIFQDFLKEQQSGHLFAESRLLKKIEGARLMFPEAHKELFTHLKK